MEDLRRKQVPEREFDIEKFLFYFVEYFLEQMTDEKRMDLFAKYCEHCGGHSPCRCWDDS